jgi:hypothetical protein
MKRRLTRNLLILALGVGSAQAWAQNKPAGPSTPAPAATPAQPPPGAEGGGADAPTKVKVEKGAGGKKIYRITDEIRIEGKIQKPEAFFFYQKSSINYDWQELKKEFIPKIYDSLSTAPF